MCEAAVRAHFCWRDTIKLVRQRCSAKRQPDERAGGGFHLERGLRTFVGLLDSHGTRPQRTERDAIGERHTNEVIEITSLERHRFESLGGHTCEWQSLLETVHRCQPAAMPAAESLEKHAPLHGRHGDDPCDIVGVRHAVIPRPI